VEVPKSWGEGQWALLLHQSKINNSKYRSGGRLAARGLYVAQVKVGCADSSQRPLFHFPLGASRPARLLGMDYFPAVPTAAPSVPFNTLRRRQVLASSLAAFAWIDASLLSTASV